MEPSWAGLEEIPEEGKNNEKPLVFPMILSFWGCIEGIWELSWAVLEPSWTVWVRCGVV